MTEERPIPTQGRGSAASRGYDGRWRAFRLAFLAAHPLCVMCAKLGITMAATVVDHIIPHRGDPELFWRDGNHQAVCKRCHDSVKQRLEKGGVESGCDENGMPLDKGHRWNHGRT